MTVAGEVIPYTLKGVQDMLGLSRGVVAGLVDAGFVSPSRGPRRELLFSFQDLVLLRTAHALQKARIAPKTIVRSLASLRAQLPDDVPLTGLRISAVGSHVVVRDGQGPWDALSGQLVMDFDVAATSAAVESLPRRGAAATPDAVAWFERGVAAEAGDTAAAELAYRNAIALDPTHLDAHVNLGALLCEAGRCASATQLYDGALTLGVESPRIHFNHAIALEDLGRFHDALASYDKAIALDPAFADAHYNAACVLEKLADARGALRHFSAYRRLQRAAEA